MIPKFAEFAAVLSCALFAGASIYINFVEHPARMECGTELAVTEFVPSYRRATMMQASLAARGFLFSIAAWLAGAAFEWLASNWTKDRPPRPQLRPNQMSKKWKI